MIEIHSHVLPGIDDGAADPDVCMLMLQQYVEQGVTDVIATPHMDFSRFSTVGQVDSYMAQVNQVYIIICQAIETRRIPIKLHFGLELALTSDLLDYLKRQREQTEYSISLAGSNYLLVELPKWLEGGLQSLEPILFQIQLLGYQTILAHPERSMRHPDTLPMIEKWVHEERVTLQINTNAIVPPSSDSPDHRQERYQRRRQYVKQLLDAELVRFVASDAHDPETRKPQNKEAFANIRDHYSTNLAQMLFRDNPQRILANEMISWNGM